LYIASYKGFDVACKLLLEHNADINKMDFEGTTPLQAAIWANQKRVVEALVAHKADINQAEILEGNTPLHVAVETNEFNLAVLLLNVSKSCCCITLGKWGF
jgi:ankyrin repeat protein